MPVAMNAPIAMTTRFKTSGNVAWRLGRTREIYASHGGIVVEQEGLTFNDNEWVTFMHNWGADQSDSDEEDAAVQRLAEYVAFREEQHAREMETDA
ncbi:hypothetical protein HDU90_007621 [Geranomyces variabilis]|nr:hypothetical protein HDU90_007621 [Geranomyces variabilis]